MEYKLPEGDRTKKYQGIDHLQIILRGEYEYLSHKKVYSQENFFVLKNAKDSSLIFDSEVLTRLDSGEFLKVYLTYQVNKTWVPIDVFIEKKVGKQVSQEKYKMDIKKNVLTYQFIMNNEIKECRLQVPPKYQIATYNSVTSFLFISSKKYDPTGKNYHNILVTNNLLTYLAPPQMNYIVLERVSTTPQNIKLNDKSVKATIYNVFSQSGHEKKNEDPLAVSISRHMSIPYLIDAPKNIKVQIKFLNEVDANNMEDYV
jgi:hypothetical protein